MQRALHHADQFLRGRGPFAASATADRPWWWLPLIVLCFSPLYGAAMGSYHCDSPQRIWMVVFSASKVPLLLLTTSLLCLPGFFVLSTVLGLRDDFRESLQAILAGQAAVSVALASLAPLTRFWYFSNGDYRDALLFNAAAFTVAGIAGQLVMLRYYRGLILRNPLHRLMLHAWLGLYAFVGIQMGWMLRPFIGHPDIPVTFFRQEPFSNAYVVVARLILGH